MGKTDLEAVDGFVVLAVQVPKPDSRSFTMRKKEERVKVPAPRYPAAVKKFITSLKIDKERTLITVVDQLPISQELEKVRHKTMVTKDALYSIAMIREWEHEDMFRTARQWCLYDALTAYLETKHVLINAASSIDALNVIKEAVIYLANSGSHNALFSNWLASCCTVFERHNRGLLVSG